MNYLRTELMRYYIHNKTTMSEIQSKAILHHVPFKTHFNWDFNLVSVLATMGNRSEALAGLLDYGVPYISLEGGKNEEDKTPMSHAYDIND